MRGLRGVRLAGFIHAVHGVQKERPQENEGPRGNIDCEGFVETHPQFDLARAHGDNAQTPTRSVAFEARTQDPSAVFALARACDEGGIAQASRQFVRIGNRKVKTRVFDGLAQRRVELVGPGPHLAVGQRWRAQSRARAVVAEGGERGQK